MPMSSTLHNVASAFGPSPTFYEDGDVTATVVYDVPCASSTLGIVLSFVMSHELCQLQSWLMALNETYLQRAQHAHIATHTLSGPGKFHAPMSPLSQSPP